MIGQLYDIEAQGQKMTPKARQQLREQQVLPIAQMCHAWLQANRLKVPEGMGITKALDYSLKRWVALARYLSDGRLPIDNN